MWSPPWHVRTYIYLDISLKIISWHSIWPYIPAVYLTYFLTFHLALSSILSDIYSDILSVILTFHLALSGILSDHIFWHSIWHIFWHILWHSIWHHRHSWCPFIQTKTKLIQLCNWMSFVCFTSCPGSSSSKTIDFLYLLHVNMEIHLIHAQYIMCVMPHVCIM